MRTRWPLVGSGIVLIAYGAWLLLSRQDPGQWLEVGIWLAAGVVAHDVLLSALLIGGSLVAARLLPQAWRAPTTIALIVWGGLTVVAIPVLSGAGARPDNTTLLDRPYLASWVVLSVLVVLVVAVAGFIGSRRSHAKG